VSDGLPFTYFKVAPFGFDQTVFDTDDLSITRGASLTLLAMPGQLQTHLEAQFPDITFDWIQISASELVFRATDAYRGPGVTIKKITGKTPPNVKASQWQKALQTKANSIKNDLNDDVLRSAAREIEASFDIKLATDETAGRLLAKCGKLPKGPPPLAASQCEKICEEIKVFLSCPNKRWPFDLMLFTAVWFAPGSSSLMPKDAIAALDTRLGHARFGQMSCIMPKGTQVSKLSASDAVCQFTGIYAAGSQPEKARPTSPNASRRRKAGRDGKQQFYQDTLEQAEAAAEEHNFSNNAQAVAALAAIGKAKGKIKDFADDFSGIVVNAPDALPLSLKSNLCVLNMDGNNFGALRGAAENINAYRRFSTYLDILKAGLLARILSWIADSDNGMLVDGVARFETLLWGGDEFTFVAPAWKGWELATVIHDAVKDWKTLDGTPMAFATGLAFGPHKAPIRDLKQAAEELAEMAKSDRTHAVWQAIAYESVDRVHFSPKHYRANWLGVAVDNKYFSLYATDAVNLPGLVQDILAATSRSALHKMYYEYQDKLACIHTDTLEISKQIDRIAPAMPEAKLDAIKSALITGGDYPLLRFAQISLLLDYIQPEAGRT